MQKGTKRLADSMLEPSGKPKLLPKPDDVSGNARLGDKVNLIALGFADWSTAAVEGPGCVGCGIDEWIVLVIGPQV